MLHEECKINQNNKIMKGVIRFFPPGLYLNLYQVMVLKKPNITKFNMQHALFFTKQILFYKFNLFEFPFLTYLDI